MDKDGFRRDLSMKRANPMDKEHFRRQLSMKSTGFMDREEVLLTNNVNDYE